MGLYEQIVAGEEKLSLVGLGYVGMPIAVARLTLSPPLSTWIIWQKAKPTITRSANRKT